MKKLIIALFVIVMFTMTPVYALGLSKGIKGGLGFANLYGDDIHNGGSSKAAICGGVFVNFSLLGLIEIQPELLYTQKRIDYDQNPFTGADMEEPYHVKLNYIEIPILGKVMMLVPGVVKPNLFAGPYFAYNLTAKGNFDTQDAQDLEFIKSTDFGMVVGLGVDVNLLVAKVTLDGRYTRGLTSIHEDGDDIKNSAFSAMLGLSF